MLKSVLIEEELHTRFKKACFNNNKGIGQVVSCAMEKEIAELNKMPEKKDSVMEIICSGIEDGYAERIRDEIYEEVAKIHATYFPERGPFPDVEFVRQIFFAGGIKKSRLKFKL